MSAGREPRRGLVGGLGGRVTLVAVVFGVAAWSYRHGLVPLDEGAVVHTAERLSRGEVLYRDVATGVAPLVYYLLAAVYALVGPSLLVARVLAALVLALGTLLVQRIAARLLGERLALLPAFGFAAVNLYGYRHFGYSPVAIGFHLLAVLLLLRFAEAAPAEGSSRAGRRALLGAGSALALCALSKQNYGVLAVAGAFVGLLLLARVRGEAPLRFAMVAAGRLAAGAVPWGAVVLLGLGAAGALDDMVRWGLQGPVAGSATAFYKPYPLLDPARPLFFADDLPEYSPFPPVTEIVPRERRRTPLAALTLVVFLGAPAVAGAALALLARELARRRRARMPGAAGAGGSAAARAVIVPSACFLFLGVFPRSDFAHLALVSPLLLVLAADLAARLPTAPRRAAAALAVGAIVASAAMPLLEIAGAGRAVAPDEPLGLARARGVKARPEEARALRAVVEALAERGVPTGPPPPVLVVPMDPLVYFLSGRPNPSAYPLVLPGAFDLASFAAALDDVDTVVLRDTGHDAMPLFVLMPEVYSLLRERWAVDPSFLARLAAPGRQPLVLLTPAERADLESRARPSGAALAGIELVADAAGEPTLRSRIVNAGERIHRPRFVEEPRIESGQWLLEPALRMRPPSGWQKLVTAFAVTPDEGASLRFALAHLPAPPSADPARQRRGAGDGERVLDGTGFEVWAWRSGGRRIERLLSTSVPSAAWRWRSTEIDLSGFAGRETVVALVAHAGPTLDELGDEVLVGRPRVVLGRSAEREELAAVAPFDPERLPGAVLDELARFTDPATFTADPPSEWPPAARARALRNRGMVEAAVGDTRAALDHLEAALDLGGDDLETLHTAAELALAGGDAELARRRFERLLGLAPGHLRALEMSARLAYDAGQPELARERASEALRRHPGSGDAGLLLARLAGDRGRDDEAVARLRPLLGGPPGAVRQQALDLLNALLPAESVEIAGRRVSRLRAPLPRPGHAAVLRIVDAPARRVVPGQPLRFDLDLVNRSPLIWPALGEPDGARRLAVGVRWLEEGSGRLSAEGRLPLPWDLGPGESARLRFEGTAPAEPGRWLLVLEMLQEGVTRFDQVAEPGEAEPLRLLFVVRSAAAGVPDPERDSDPDSVEGGR